MCELCGLYPVRVTAYLECEVEWCQGWPDHEEEIDVCDLCSYELQIRGWNVV